MHTTTRTRGMRHAALYDSGGSVCLAAGSQEPCVVCFKMRGEICIRRNQKRVESVALARSRVAMCHTCLARACWQALAVVAQVTAIYISVGPGVSKSGYGK
jgi:hypothetical protein